MSKTNAPLTHKEIMVVLSGLMTGMLLAALDQTIVSTALKRIVEDFNGLNHYTWVVTAYILTSTASTPLYGKVSDLYGRRPVYQFAIITFLIGSLLAGASQNMSQLIATRALQGLGAGGLMALTFVIIGDIVAPRDRGKYQGYFGAVWGLSVRGRTTFRWIFLRSHIDSWCHWLALDFLHQSSIWNPCHGNYRNRSPYSKSKART